MSHEVVGYLGVTWFALIAAAAVLFFGSSRDVRFCQGELQELPEPAAWRSWPDVPGDGRFLDIASGEGPKFLVGEEALCPGDQLSVSIPQGRGWPHWRGPVPESLASAGFWPSFRKDPLGDVWVAAMRILPSPSGDTDGSFARIPGRAGANEVFLTAFRDTNARHLVFDVRGAALLTGLSVAIALLIRALVFGHLRLRAARRLAAVRRMKETAYRSAACSLAEVAAIETQVEHFVLRTLRAAGALVVGGTLVMGFVAACY